MSIVVSQPIASIPRGISDGGPTSVTRAPISASAWMFERATRECRTSPTIATCRPSMRPNACWIVYRSRSACVGCWCFPSPALTMCAPVTRATSCGAPIDGWRMTITSGPYASSVSAVSLSDSPLSTADPDALIDITSAESRLAASSKLEEVRVDDSKKRFTTVRPRSVGSFFISRSRADSKERAVASSRSTSSRVRSAIEIRCRLPGGRGGSSSRTSRISVIGLFPLRGRNEQDTVDLVDLDELHLDALAVRGWQVLADVVGTDGKLAVPAIAEDGELHAGRASVVEERLDRGSDRAPGVEHVVDEHARAPLEGEVEPRGTHERLGMKWGRPAPHLDVVAVEGDVHRAERHLDSGELLDQRAQPVREWDAARVDADQRDRLEVGVALDDLMGDAVERAFQRLRVEENSLGRGRLCRLGHRTPFQPQGTGLKDSVDAGA